MTDRTGDLHRPPTTRPPSWPWHWWDGDEATAKAEAATAEYSHRVAECEDDTNRCEICDNPIGDPKQTGKLCDTCSYHEYEGRVPK